MIRVLLADDHAIVRNGLARILEKDGDMKIVAEHENGLDALKWVLHHDCDIVLLDIAMPGISGIDLLKQIRLAKAKLPVLVISIYPEDQYAVRLIKAGAAGYLAKGCSPAILIEAIRHIVSGKKYISPTVAEILAHEVTINSNKQAHETLSDREYQIFLLLASAKTVSEIAVMLALSSKTVSTYRSRILEKMQLRNNAEMMHYVLDKQLMAN